MKITYDDEANASYVYFTHIGPGGVAETVPFLEMDVDLDEAAQIVALRLAESEECVFQKRLKYALQHSNVYYDESRRSLVITFGENPEPTKSTAWEATIDLDAGGQILGLEILFADPDYGPDDGRERLYAVGKLKRMAKYIVPFEELH